MRVPVVVPAITVAEARSQVMARLPELPVIPVPLLEALDRAIATDVHAPFDLPAFTNAAVDGFAVRAADACLATAQVPVRLPVVATVAAGPGTPAPLLPGTAVRIMTGAVLPLGADVALKVEECVELDGVLVLSGPVRSSDGVRPQGEEVARGARLLLAGDRLTPARLGLVANLGLATVPVRRAPRVAIFATGDELVEPGQPLGPGQIFNGNAHALAAMITEAGGEPVRWPLVADTREATLAQFMAALTCDLVVSSGGVSMGGFDFVADALRELGEVHFASVRQQPGKPMVFATVQGVPFFGLPGNPVSAMVGFEIYVRPALRAMLGHHAPQRPRVIARLRDPVRKDPAKTVFLRAFLESGPEGFVARLTGAQGSGMATSMAAATALLELPEGPGQLEAGAPVTALVLAAERVLDLNA